MHLEQVMIWDNNLSFFTLSKDQNDTVHQKLMKPF